MNELLWISAKEKGWVFVKKTKLMNNFFREIEREMNCLYNIYLIDGEISPKKLSLLSKIKLQKQKLFHTACCLYSLS